MLEWNEVNINGSDLCAVLREKRQHDATAATEIQNTFIGCAFFNGIDGNVKPLPEQPVYQQVWVRISRETRFVQPAAFGLFQNFSDGRAVSSFVVLKFR